MPSDTPLECQRREHWCAGCRELGQAAGVTVRRIGSWPRVALAHATRDSGSRSSQLRIEQAELLQVELRYSAG